MVVETQGVVLINILEFFFENYQNERVISKSQLRTISSNIKQENTNLNLIKDLGQQLYIHIT